MAESSNSYLKVYNKFEMKTIKDYHDLYLKCDPLLLADVFEKFRNNNLKSYGTRCEVSYISNRYIDISPIAKTTKSI